MAMKAEHKIRLLEVLDIFKAVGIAILLVLAIQTLHKQGEQINGINKIVTQLNTNSHQRTVQINDLQHHIDCIVELFQQPNRANLTITDLQDCQITTSSVKSSTYNWPAASTPSQSNNSGDTPEQTATSGGVENTTQPDNNSGLDNLPVLGRVFKTLGL